MNRYSNIFEEEGHLGAVMDTEEKKKKYINGKVT